MTIRPPGFSFCTRFCITAQVSCAAHFFNQPKLTVLTIWQDHNVTSSRCQNCTVSSFACCFTCTTEASRLRLLCFVFSSQVLLLCLRQCHASVFSLDQVVHGVCMLSYARVPGAYGRLTHDKIPASWSKIYVGHKPSMSKLAQA